MVSSNCSILTHQLLLTLATRLKFNSLCQKSLTPQKLKPFFIESDHQCCCSHQTFIFRWSKQKPLSIQPKLITLCSTFGLLLDFPFVGRQKGGPVK